MKTRSRYAPALVAGLLFIPGCGGEKAHRAGRPASVEARLLTARMETVPSVLEVPGTVQPRERVSLSSQINGFVHNVRVRSGDTVTSGQVLVTLDSREAESQKAAAQAAVREAQEALAEAAKAEQMIMSQRDAARANARLAEDTLSRYQKLFEARSVSPQELDEMRARRAAAAAELAARETAVSSAQSRIRQVEAKIAQANAQLQRAEVTVSWTVVKAPAAGKVVQRLVDQGTAIFPGSPLLVLESLSAPQVVADLPSRQAGILKAGLVVRVLAEAGTPLQGRVTEIVPVSDAGSHTVRFKVDIHDHVPLRSGSFARVLIPMGERQALLLPRSAVRETGQLTGIFIADSASTARFRLVRTAPFDDERVEVLSGLEAGERVVLGAGPEIADGVALEIRS
ncbi:MAG: efflux RND transporter periplasmic adaptor subunit [Acidobacteria bacterium]|nr:efflux RND transporter periplasmic adaptor subunit [Acidobacteriota bacterium]